jgi:hypothetical protein
MANHGLSDFTAALQRLQPPKLPRAQGSGAGQAEHPEPGRSHTARDGAGDAVGLVGLTHA